MTQPEIVLSRDCNAILIPDGEVVVLEKNTKITITRALGDTLTVMTPFGLFRINKADLTPLDEKTTEPPTPSGALDAERIREVLRTCYDPEIPLNIIDLGLIYDIALDTLPDGRSVVRIKMTLTAPGCAMGPVITGEVKTKIEALPGVERAEVDIVIDPPWTPSCLSPDGRKQLGLE
ncbi:MAG: iron-sulfur cluster assembly protein [Puniceicoccales bacterium]|jgi:probable FeS assembly SUF system protein SufT|nr:iron-sulfur cluster assembly protein [Puniceicoccales bacterium]